MESEDVPSKISIYSCPSAASKRGAAWEGRVCWSGVGELVVVETALASEYIMHPYALTSASAGLTLFRALGNAMPFASVLRLGWGGRLSLCHRRRGKENVQAAM